MKTKIKSLSLILVMMCLMLVSGCGDDKEGLPFWINSTKSVIDFSNPLEDGVARIDVTVFDTKGNPLKDGKMYFTLSANSGGSLYDSEKKEYVKTVSLDLDDGVAEVFFYASQKNETVVVTAHCPSYPNNGSASVSITVRGGSSFWLSSNKSTIDLSSATDYTSTLTAYVYETTGEPVTTGSVRFSLGAVAGFFIDSTGTRVKTIDADVYNGSASTLFYAANTNESVTITASYPGYANQNTAIRVVAFTNTADFTTSVKLATGVYTVTFTDSSTSGPTPDDKIVQWDWSVWKASDGSTTNYTNIGKSFSLDLSSEKDRVCMATLTIHRQSGVISSLSKNFIVQ